jgi:hypothetical protein
MHQEIRIRSAVPPKQAGVARFLWSGGVPGDLASEVAGDWGPDYQRAWLECHRLECILPLAIARTANVPLVAQIGAQWLQRARAELDFDTRLVGDDHRLFVAAIVAAVEPISVRAGDLKAQLHARAKAHYYPLTAAAHLAGIADRRVSPHAHLAIFDAWCLGEMLLGAFGELERKGQGDLFAAGVDTVGFVEWAIGVARERCA